MPSFWVSRKTEALEKLSQAVLGEHMGRRSCQSHPARKMCRRTQRKTTERRGCHHVPPQAPPAGSPGMLPKQSPTIPPARHGMQSHISPASVQSRGSRLGSCLHLGSVCGPSPSARALPGAPGAEQPRLPLPSEKALIHAALGTGTSTFAFWDLR